MFRGRGVTPIHHRIHALLLSRPSLSNPGARASMAARADLYASHLYLKAPTKLRWGAVVPMHADAIRMPADTVLGTASVHALAAGAIAVVMFQIELPASR